MKRLDFMFLNLSIDPFRKWLLIVNSLVSIKISLTNLVFKLIIQKNFYSHLKLGRLVQMHAKEF